MKLIRTLLAVIFATIFTSTASAQLTWEKKEVEVHPSVGDQDAVAHFAYQNTGDKVVHIGDVETSCGCTVATLEKKDVAPGEKGEIKATLKIGDRMGVQQKTIRVQTDEAVNPVTVLTLKAVVPQLLEISPRFVRWGQGEPLDVKTIVVKVGAEFPVTKLNVTSSDPTMETAVEEGATPKEFKINVRPKEGGRPFSATLTIKPDYPVEAPKTYYASAAVVNSAVKK